MATTARTGTLSVIATGVFTAGGVAHSGQKADLLVFPAGTIKIVPYAGGGSQKINPKTCLLTETMKADYNITGGTGKYAGISGKGTYTGNILGIVARSGGKCQRGGPFTTFQEFIRGSASVNM
jgi:hypothetical protein